MRQSGLARCPRPYERRPYRRRRAFRRGGSAKLFGRSLARILRANQNQVNESRGVGEQFNGMVVVTSRLHQQCLSSAECRLLIRNDHSACSSRWKGPCRRNGRIAGIALNINGRQPPCPGRIPYPHRRSCPTLFRPPLEALVAMCSQRPLAAWRSVATQDPLAGACVIAVHQPAQGVSRACGLLSRRAVSRFLYAR
jgi:hypothetical protein